MKSAALKVLLIALAGAQAVPAFVPPLKEARSAATTAASSPNGAQSNNSSPAAATSKQASTISTNSTIVGAPPGKVVKPVTAEWLGIPDYTDLVPGNIVVLPSSGLSSITGGPAGSDGADGGAAANSSLASGVADWISNGGEGKNTTLQDQMMANAPLPGDGLGLQQSKNSDGSIRPPTILWDVDQLISNKEVYQAKSDPYLVQAVDGVIYRAIERVSNGTVYSVTNSTLTPPSGDKRDYMSIGPYMWPCNNNPCNKTGASANTTCDVETGLPWVSCDGSKNPELIVAGLSDRHFANFHLAVTDVALAYWYTGNTTFAEFGANLTRVFFVDPTTRMNPHLKYAQLQPGVRDGSPSGVIDFMKIIEILDALEIIRMEPFWTPNTDQALMVLWLRQMLRWLLVSQNGMRARAAPNNVAWWFHQTALALALHVADTNTTMDLAFALPDLANEQISIDGILVKEVTRPKSRDYVAYTLCAITRAARVARWARLDLWTLDRVKNAVQWPMPYMIGAQWPYPDSNPDFDWKFLAETWRSSAVSYGDDPFSDVFYISGGAGNVYGYGLPPSLVYAPPTTPAPSTANYPATYPPPPGSGKALVQEIN